MTLTNLPKWPPVDVAFNDISFSVSECRQKGYKTILKGVSGMFRSGELSAIMGPSKCPNNKFFNDSQIQFLQMMGKFSREKNLIAIYFSQVVQGKVH